jgi:hypothetical protein
MSGRIERADPSTVLDAAPLKTSDHLEMLEQIENALLQQE